MTKGTNRRRIFTNEFALGDEVSIIRQVYGYVGGYITGRIVEMTETTCVVAQADGSRHEINHPRDIRK